MSLSSLVRFAQQQISRQQLIHDRQIPPPAYSRLPQEVMEPSTVGDEPTISRSEIPVWLRNPASEIVPFEEGMIPEFETDESIAVTRLTDVLSGTFQKVGLFPDALAYYLPYHFYADGVWGIYVWAKGIVELACQIKGSTITRTDVAELLAAQSLLLDHEYFHSLTEAAATRAEIVTQSPIYHPYFHDKRSATHEEAMSNGHAYRQLVKINKSFGGAVGSWMDRQGVGYRDFRTFLKNRMFIKGRNECGRNIVGNSPPGRAVGSLPCGFLFKGHSRVAVPTYLVVEEEIAPFVYKRFQKFNDMAIRVHSREHPPPHFHIEMPPGVERTRYIWPELQPMKGDRKLSHKEEDRLREYLARFGAEIHSRLARVYSAHSLTVPPLHLENREI